MSNLVFSEYIPSCIFFFSVNNEGYSAKDCKLLAQIAPALVTCDHLENVDVSVIGAWFWLHGQWARRRPQAFGEGLGITKVLAKLFLTFTSTTAYQACHLHSQVSCTVSAER